MHRLPILGLIAILAAALPAQYGKNTCYECKDAGVLVCKSKDCKQALVCGIKGEHKCDALYAAKCCRGVQKTPCPKCEDPINEAEVLAQMEIRAAWVEKMRAYDDACQTRFSHVETDHWFVHLSLPQWKVGDAVLSRVKTAHLFAERLEAMALKLKDVFGALPPAKMRAFIVSGPDEMGRTTLTQQGILQKDLPFKLYGPAGSFTIRPMPGTGGVDMGSMTDDTFHPHLMHTGAHLLTQATYGFKHQFAPWIDEAVSHWIEIEGFKRQGTFCFREVSNNRDPWRASDWRPRILSEVASRKEDQFATLITYQDDKLSPRQKAHCWSFFDFFVKTKPKEFQVFFKELKATNDTKKALEKALGMSTAAFHDKWREYVLKTYPP